MICNNSMERLLPSIETAPALLDEPHPIHRRTTPNGTPYWTAGNFCGLERFAQPVLIDVIRVAL